LATVAEFYALAKNQPEKIRLNESNGNGRLSRQKIFGILVPFLQAFDYNAQNIGYLEIFHVI